MTRGLASNLWELAVAAAVLAIMLFEVLVLGEEITICIEEER